MFPFLSFIIIRWILPFSIGLYPPIADYSVVILMWTCMQGASLFGFIYGFLFLEEKEENINLAYYVLPQSNFKIAITRLSIGMIISAIVNFTLLHFGNILTIPLIYEILISIQYSFLAPFMALYLDVFAKNKIEGLAQIKIVNLLIITPALIYFFPFKILHVTALIPTYWSFRSIEFANDSGMFLLFNSIGILYYFGLIVFLNFLVKRRNY
jgi:hypothetical protein